MTRASSPPHRHPYICTHSYPYSIRPGYVYEYEYVYVYGKKGDREVIRQ